MLSFSIVSSMHLGSKQAAACSISVISLVILSEYSLTRCMLCLLLSHITYWCKVHSAVLYTFYNVTGVKKLVGI